MDLVCKLISEALNMGLVISPISCADIKNKILVPLIKGDLKNIATVVPEILIKILDTQVQLVKEGVNMFASFIKSFNVCLPVYVNHNYWMAKMKPVIAMFKSIKDGIDLGKTIIGSLQTALQECKTWSVIFPMDFQIMTRSFQVGLYVTFDISKGFPVQEVGIINGYSNNKNIKGMIKGPQFNIGVELAVSIVMGDKKVWGEWGYSVGLSGDIPITGVSVGMSGGLVFTADSKTKALGNFIGVSFSISKSIGVESAWPPKIVASITCGYVAAKSFADSFTAEEASQCSNVGKRSLVDVTNEKKEIEKKVLGVFDAKLDQIRRCGELYKCAAKQCVYHFDAKNYKKCKRMANTCADDFKTCGKWQTECTYK